MAARDHDGDTISAVATPPGEGGIGIVRLSGERALAIADKVFKAGDGKSAAAQNDFTAKFGHVISDGKKIDEALLLVMRGPKSYTGEDTVEIQAHGGPALLETLLQRTVHFGARPAAPGEFTKRAFLNGRLDLIQAEAVLDLIQAKTERSLRWAASQLDGELSRKMSALKETLLETLAHLEASVDFPDDSPETRALERVGADLESAARTLKGLLKGADFAILAKRGLRVALWGRPNVGKSSLLNTLTRTDRVIVTPHPGTTRDVVEEESLIGGFPVRFMDTAGIQDTEHPIEKEGIERSRKAVLGADLILFVLDASRSLTEEDKKLAQEIGNRPAIAVLNKSDLPKKIDGGAALAAALWAGTSAAPAAVFCSCVKEGGDQALREAILRHIAGGKTGISEEPAVQSARQKEHLEKALEGVERARKACLDGLSGEFIASDVRLSLDSLGRLAGEVVTDDMLEVLFNRFCIGK